jgi:hypothetical protein
MRIGVFISLSSRPGSAPKRHKAAVIGGRPHQHITLPLKIRHSDESFAVEDAAGRSVSCVHFDDDPSRRAQTRRFSQDEAREIAQMIARLLTDVDAEVDASASRTIPLEDLSAENDE